MIGEDGQVNFDRLSIQNYRDIQLDRIAEDTWPQSCTSRTNFY